MAAIFEFGNRRRLIVLGRISALLPRPDNDLVRLNLDAFGVLDFDEFRLSIDAVLVDSRLAHKFVLTGGMALRLRWVPGPRAGFALAIGGMNPRFTPPAEMPALDRVTIALASGDNPRITCEAYFALTANTVQFGARASLYAEAYGFNVQGDVGFDVLLQLLPFHFIADFKASIQLRRGSRNLFKVSVAGSLEGPRPLRVSAKASFEILWCDFTIRFDKTLISGELPPLPPAIDALLELRQALSEPQSWSAQRPAQRQHGVALREPPPGPLLVLDPLGVLQVKQGVVPLNTTRDLDLFGGAPLAGERRFKLDADLSGQQLSVATVQDQFPPAQFFEMSDEEKLVSPSFETMDAGAVFGSEAYAFDAATAVGSPLEFETIVVDVDGSVRTLPSENNYVLDHTVMLHHLKLSAVGMAALRRTGMARFREAAAPPAAMVKAPQWMVASLTEASTLADVAGHGTTWIERREAMLQLNRAAPDGIARWGLVPEHELVA